MTYLSYFVWKLGILHDFPEQFNILLNYPGQLQGPAKHCEHRVVRVQAGPGPDGRAGLPDRVHPHPSPVAGQGSEPGQKQQA